MINKAIDTKHEAKLAARRVRDKKARDTLADSYIRKLIRQSDPAIWSDRSDIPWELVEAARICLAVRRRLLARDTPEMDAAMKGYSEALNKKINLKSTG